MSSRTHRSLALAAGLALVLASTSSAVAASGARKSVMPTLQAARGSRPGGGGSANLKYNGGNPGVITGSGKIYLVFWGSQWTGNDPSGEAAIMQSFVSHVGGSSWNNSVTQYCQGVAKGATTCGTSADRATNNANLLGGVWYDAAAAAPSRPGQSQIAAEAAAAAAYFGVSSADNAHVQFVVMTATGNSMRGFGTQWCAWHSSTSSSIGTIAYTYLPYITDAGSSCGANFNGMGPTAGITMVGGHEIAEAETDIFPSGGWTDGNGAENADKCAWSSLSAPVSLTGATFPVQPLWSNAANGGKGGCVLSY
jgi:hypothetical protein